MLSKIITASIIGIEAKIVTVETDINGGLPALNIVGLADITVRESKERIRSAIINSGGIYPKSRITVNLAPANLKKKGSHFDLAIAIGIMVSNHAVFDGNINSFGFVGELSLDGSINSVRGILPMVLAIRKNKIKNVIIPRANKEEALLVKDINIFIADNLASVVKYFNFEEKLECYINEENVLDSKPVKQNSKIDFSDVKGQESAKRAVVIGVAGNHGILMTGSPGAGKTMISQRIPTIMPDMTYDEIIETTIIYSVAGYLNEEQPYITERPFRQPHHKITPAGFIGGGGNPKPGEISLANNGVLFLDEVGEFDGSMIDMLRVPLEKKSINIFRKGESHVFPANFLLVAARNPCKCGYYGDSRHECKCTPHEIDNYKKKLSGPILDRIDIHIELNTIDYEQLTGKKTTSSNAMQRDISRVRLIQKNRYVEEKISYNSELGDNLLEKYCPLGEKEKKLMKEAFSSLNLNPRTFAKIIKVARTISDLEASENIKQEHIAEALRYRSLDKIYERV